MLTPTGLDFFRDIILFGMCVFTVYILWNLAALILSKITDEWLVYREYRARQKFVKEIEENRNACD